MAKQAKVVSPAVVAALKSLFQSLNPKAEEWEENAYGAKLITVTASGNKSYTDFGIDGVDATITFRIPAKKAPVAPMDEATARKVMADVANSAQVDPKVLRRATKVLTAKKV